MKKYWIHIVSVILLFAAVISMAMWDANGNLLDFISGQMEPGPKPLQSDVSIHPGNRYYTTSVEVNTSGPINTVSAEYISFAIDSSQVVGGKWWNPVASSTEIGSGTVHAPVFNFNRPMLDLLTSALAPAYLRIGGSEADKIYYDMTDNSTFQPSAPAGYKSVMTARQWDDVNAFADRNGLKLIFTLNAGPASRKADGSWDGTNAEDLLRYTAHKGYKVDLWELGNELNIFWFVHGLKAQVSPLQYDKDLQAARALIRNYMPASRFAGQGSAFWPLLGEPLNLFYGFMPQFLEKSGGSVEIVSWHYYPQQSKRGPIASRRAYPSRLLDPKNLDEAAYWAGKMQAWRDSYAAGKPLWVGETGNAQFGGEPGLSDVYLGGLWWLDELGLLAAHGHDTVVRQSLTGMNYGIIDEDSLSPRPDYWNSLLWKQLMGSHVYSTLAKGENASKLRVYAHGKQGQQGETVTILAINMDPQLTARVSLPQYDGRRFDIYEVTTPDIFGTTLLVNGGELKISADSSIPAVHGEQHFTDISAGIEIHPLSYTFISLYR